MSRFVAWTWKEFREQRWTFVGLSGAVALFTALPFVVVPAELTVRMLDLFPGVAVALATLVLGLDLFAREARRGTQALILRTPGALRAAFPAKLVVFLLGVAVALVIEEALRRGLSGAMGVPYPTQMVRGGDGEMHARARDMSPAFAFGIPMSVFTALLAIAVGVWHVVGSVISPRAGVGALFGVLGLAVLSIPLSLLFSNHPWWFRLPTHEAYGWLAGLIVAGFVVAALAWLSGRRYLFPRRRAAVRAGVAGLVLCGLATGATARAIDRWETPDASVPDLRVQAGMTRMGTGGRHMYVTTSRGPLGNRFDGFGGADAAPLRSSAPTAWTIDLTTGAAVDVRYGGFFLAPPGTGHVVVPIPYVVRVETRPSQVYGLAGSSDPWTWIDTERGTPVFTARDGTVDARTIAATRAVAKAVTPGRDSKGRRVWRLHGVVERDGDENRVPVPVRAGPHEDRIASWGITSPGVLGWEGSGLVPESSPETFGLWLVDMETGTSRRLAASGYDDEVVSVTRHGDLRALGSSRPVPDGDYAVRTWQGRLLDEAHSLRRWAATGRDGAEFDSGWQVMEHATGVYRPLGGPRLDYEVELVDVGTLLIRDPIDASSTAADGATRLTLWKPIPNDRRLVTSPDPSLLAARWIDGQGRLPDGRWLVSVYDAPGRKKGRVAFTLLDAKTATLTPLTRWSAVSLEAIAVDIDGSFLAIEDGRRVVRFSEAGAKRTVAWPK